MARPPTREMLYAPGGLFGPKGPFSTPHVRYPNGMEMPPRKASRAPSRISAMKTPNPYSEIGSVVAEDRSVKSSYAMNAMIQRPFSPGEMSSKPPSRMETYRADWEELPFEDLDKWQEEKAKRMLAWIHTLHGSEHIGTETPWWKVWCHLIFNQWCQLCLSNRQVENTDFNDSTDDLIDNINDE